MRDSDRFDDAPGDTAAQPHSPSPPGAPRWVKLTGIAVLVVVVLLIVFKLAGVEHGPGRHGASGGVARQTPAPEVAHARAPASAQANARPSGADATVSTTPDGLPQHDAPQPS